MQPSANPVRFSGTGGDNAHLQQILGLTRIPGTDSFTTDKPKPQMSTPPDPAIVQKPGQTATQAVVETRTDYVNQGRAQLKQQEQNYTRTSAGTYLSM